MPWKMSPDVSHTLGYVTPCPAHQHVTMHGRTLGYATTHVLQLEGIPIRDTGVCHAQPAGTDGSRELGLGFGDVGLGWASGSLGVVDTPQCNGP